MAELTSYSAREVWGSSGFTSTTDLKVGKSGSSSYRGRITFEPLPKYVVITSLK